jgi:hypothetical protein
MCFKIKHIISKDLRIRLWTIISQNGQNGLIEIL